MKKTTILWLVLLLCQVALSQTLTLDSCLKLGREHNADLRTSRLEIECAKQVKAQVFTKYFPQVQAGFMAYHSLNPLIEFGVQDLQNQDLKETLQLLVDEIKKQDPDFVDEITLMRHGLSVSATAYQPIFMGGRVINGNRLAQLGIEAAELQAEVKERDVLEEIETTFYLVIGLEEKVETLASVMSLLDSLDRTVSSALASGLVTQTDALRVSMKRNEMLAKQQQLMSGIRLSKRLLCQQIGIAYSDDLRLQNPFGVNAADAVIPQSNVNRPEERLLQLQVDAERYRKRLTVGEALPQVVLGGSYFWGNILKDDYSHNGLLFLTATVPLTGWWETAHKIREHNLRIEAAHLQREQLQGMMSLEEEKAYSDMMVAEALLRSDSAALAMAQENYRLMLVNYDAGLSTLTDVLEANALLLEAQNALTDRRISYLSAKRRVADIGAKP